jgi:hypothetical protein
MRLKDKAKGNFWHLYGPVANRADKEKGRITLERITGFCQASAHQAIFADL